MEGEKPPDQGPRFQFIDISSTNARKEARAHVMREFMRQKREEQPDAPKPAKAPRKRQKAPAENPTGKVKAVRVRKDLVKGKVQGSGESSLTESDTSAQPDSCPSDTPSNPETRLARRPSMRLVTSRSSSPHSPIDASRRDPFSAFPMKMDEEDLPLVDHCTPSPSLPKQTDRLLTCSSRHHGRSRTDVQFQRRAPQVWRS